MSSINRKPIPAILLALVLLLVTPTLAAQIDEIQAAIDANGGGWLAANTPQSLLSTEAKKQLAGFIPPDLETFKNGPRFKSPLTDDELPTQWDWRNVDGRNYMSPVKDQGYCGSCWAFAAIGATEGVIAAKEHIPDLDLDLSEQHLLSCSLGGGCELGGLTNIAMSYIADIGVPDDACWEYEAEKLPCGGTCPDWQTRTATVDGWSWVDNDVTQIKLALLDGPVVTSMSLYEDFYSYNSGVYKRSWGAFQGWHAIVIAGWNNADSSWIVKNSWGKYWGESGYFRIKWNNSAFGRFSIHIDYTPTGQYGDDDDFADDDSGDDDDDDNNDDSGDDDIGDDDDDDNDDDDDDSCGS